MKISLITVTFNSSQTLRDTIQSVVYQNYTDIEYIIVDGLSTDSTIDIIKEYEPLFNGRMKWISEKDKGIYDAMNKGITMSTGDIVGVLNSDDVFYDTNVLSDIASAFLHQQVKAVFADLKFVSSRNLNSVVRVWKGSSYRPNSFKKGWHPAHPTFYAKRSVYEKYGVFDLSFNVSADFELMLRFIAKYQISTYYLNRYIVKMRIGGESTGSISKIVEGNRNIIRAFKKNNIPLSQFYFFYRFTPKIWNIITTKFAR